MSLISTMLSLLTSAAALHRSCTVHRAFFQLRRTRPLATKFAKRAPGDEHRQVAAVERHHLSSAPRWNSLPSYRIVPCRLCRTRSLSLLLAQPSITRTIRMKNYKFGLNLSLTLFVTIRSHSKSDKDDDYRMANIFTKRCSSKIVPKTRILNSLSFETALL